MLANNERDARDRFDVYLKEAEQHAQTHRDRMVYVDEQEETSNECDVAPIETSIELTRTAPTVAPMSRQLRWSALGVVLAIGGLLVTVVVLVGSLV